MRVKNLHCKAKYILLNFCYPLPVPVIQWTFRCTLNIIMNKKNAIFVKEGDFSRFLNKKRLPQVNVTSWVFITHVNMIEVIEVEWNCKDWQRLTIKDELELRNWVTLHWKSGEKRQQRSNKLICLCKNECIKSCWISSSSISSSPYY